MPGMDGMALLRRLSFGGFRGGIVLCSALEDDVVDAVLRMSRAYGLQVLGRIEKPASPSRSRSSSVPGGPSRCAARRRMVIT